MPIKIPNPKKKRALIIVDVQSSFADKNNPIVSAIEKVIRDGKYHAIIEAVFSTEGNPLWKKQTGWICEFKETLPEIKNLIDKSPLKIYSKKNTKSAWKGTPDIYPFIKKNGIEEIHVIGYDANDCVMATAMESFDLGFQTYVIEEAVGSSNGENLRKEAIEILRNVDGTNHSELIEDFMII